MNARNGDWIQTYSGLRFWPLDPRPEDINIVDIAHALSMLCRYGGHCIRFYSVAEHSYLVSLFCSDELAMWGLLHDASEAYLVDVPRPIKKELTNYKQIEEQIMKCVAEKFNLCWPMPDEVQKLDHSILGNEKKQIMVDGPAWHTVGEPIEDLKVVGWMPQQAKDMFLMRFNQLYFLR